MPFSRPTLQNIVDRIEGDITTRVENAASFLRRSVFKILARAYAGAVYTIYGYINYIKDQLFATTADVEYLEIIGSEYGITRKDADKATGIVRLTGTNGSVVIVGTELQFVDEQVYLTDETVIIDGGYADVGVTAKVAGSAGNQDPGGSLTFVSPLVGIDTTATIDSLGITGGVDKESDDDLRDRILARKRQPPQGGAEFDYKTWALEVEGVTRVWTFPLYQGIGTIGVAFVRDDDANTIIPDSDQMQEMYDYIVEHTDPLTGLIIGCPVTAVPGLFIVPLTIESLNFSIGLYPNDATTQANATTALENLILDKCGPGETLYQSDIVRYIAEAGGVTTVRVNTPAADTAFAVNRVPVLGTITFEEY